MASEIALTMLRADLGCISGTLPQAMHDLLGQKLDAARQMITRRGLTIDESMPDDLDLLVSVAGWLYRHREDGAEMSKMAKQEIRDRQVGRATAGSGT